MIMAILNFTTTQTGTAGILPSIAQILTNDTEAAVLTAGYLNHLVQNGASFTLPCLAEVSTKASSTADYQVGWYQVVHVGANWSLVPAGSPGDVVLPTIANHLAVYTNTTGGLSDDAATAINGGNIQAGLSGTAGYFASFPATASKGSLRVTAVANTGDTLVTISNALHGQASVYSIPDVGAATGQFNVVTGALVNGNLMSASGTAGKLADSGVAVTALQLKAQVKSATTSNIGGAGAGPITVTVAGLTAASVVVATIATSSNPVSVVKAIAGTGNFDVTFSGDPGATCTLNYVAYIAAQ